MPFENNPNATASITATNPVIIQPGMRLLTATFETSLDGFTPSLTSGANRLGTPGGTTGHGPSSYYLQANRPAYPYTGPVLVTRTLTNLIVGRRYRVTGWVGAGTPVAVNNARLGVEGIGYGPTVATLSNVLGGVQANWKQAAYEFNAELTTHTILLEHDSVSGGDPLSSSAYWDDIIVDLLPVYDTEVDMSVTAGTMTLDANRYPYVQASVEVPMSSYDQVEEIIPGKRVRVHATAGGSWNRVYTPWVEERRNLATSPRPTVWAGSLWAGSAGLGELAAPGWVGGTLTGAATTPYIFSSLSSRAYAAGEKVTLSIRYRVTAIAGAATHITVRPHQRVGNIYYPDAAVLRPIVIGQDEDVVIQWTTPVAIASGNLDLAVLGSNAGGGFGSANAGFGLRATRVLIEDGWTDGSFFDGNTDPAGELTQTRWLGTANASMSVYETREIERVDWIPDEGVLADLTLRSRELSHDKRTINLNLASDEAILDSWSPISDDSGSRAFETSVRAICNYVLAKVFPLSGIALQPGTADADISAQWDATNLLKNPNANTNITNWATGSSATTLAYNSGAGQDGTAGFVRATQTGGSGAVFLASTAFDLSAREGQMFTASVYARHSTAAAVASITLRFMDSNNAIVRDVTSATKAMTTEWGNRWNVTGVAPANTAKVVPIMSLFGSASGWTWDLDKAMLTEGPVLLPYFDGGTPNTANYTYAWEEGANVSASVRTATPERLPELFTWEAGQTAWDFLEPLTAAAGLRLFSGLDRKWYLVDPATYTVPGAVNSGPGVTVQGADTIDVDDDDSGYTGVVAVFKWTDKDGTNRTKKDIAGTEGKVKVLEFDRPYPGPGIAAAHLAKVEGVSRALDVTMATNYNARPGMVFTVFLADTAPQITKVGRVQWELATGLMNVTSL